MLNFKRVLISASTLLLFIAVSQILFSQSDSLINLRPQKILPSNPMEGRIVFEEKGCIDCHAIDGFGGKIGPDLGREEYFGSFYTLASKLWNHAPQMTVQSGFQEKEWPTMSGQELDQLISYLFYLRYLGEPGNISKGKRLLKSNHCLSCHRIGNEGSSDGIALDQLQEYASPLYIAQVIWNHGPQMHEEMINMGIERPTFDDNDITDISAYLRELSRGKSTRRQYMSPGNPQSGATQFKEKGCINCHASVPDESTQGAWLGEMDLHRSVTAIAGTMWNHGNIMWREMKEKKVDWPTFEGSEMADLIAYLYFFDYQNAPPGNTGLGKRIFETKSCQQCHGPEQPYAFSRTIYLATPTDLIQTMWNHVPYMHELVVTKNIEWPELTEQDLCNLYTYLLQLSPGE